MSAALYELFSRLFWDAGGVLEVVTQRFFPVYISSNPHGSHADAPRGGRLSRAPSERFVLAPGRAAAGRDEQDAH